MTARKKAAPATVTPLVDAPVAQPAEATQPVNTPPADVIALVDLPVAEAAPAPTAPATVGKQTASLSLAGYGGTIRINVDGGTAAKHVKLKPVGALPKGVALTGVESEEGSALVRWVASPPVQLVVEVEILL